MQYNKNYHCFVIGVGVTIIIIAIIAAVEYIRHVVGARNIFGIAYVCLLSDRIPI